MVVLIHPDELVREIIAKYCLNVDQDIKRFKAIGKEWQKRYEWLTYDRPSLMPATNHMFDDNIRYPPPSTYDEAHARSRFHYGAQWKFEKTVFQNQHIQIGQHQFLRRIVHLFARINDYGEIEDASAQSH
jgi:hypothetical protein